ncbi:PTS system glucose-specific EIIA component [Rubrobacter xylanophilus DSM 9941]|uniref:PTS sugar transporter subunit IIA n=1 Tax=Rubrobacter xylanophilus TaxID=49319 RepID=UPI001C63BC16|nr:PTS glucose transporter subunit IIA [Rubrobacter xylanophilus]QYJ15007.1 PTS system glucose-specific EIIA component [Rubrobacter xylanophilus DSM 9941]
MQILSPISGEAVPLSEVPDEVFAEGMAGQGAAVVPDSGGVAVAPVSGTLVKLFEGGHAFGIETEGGVELIVHLGLDTIELRGDGFERLATEGERVEAGEPVVRFDLERIRSSGYDPITPVVVTNPEEHPVSSTRTGPVRAGEPLFETRP